MTAADETPAWAKPFTVEDMHAIEWAAGWQYGVVWRFADPSEPNTLDTPPAGDGWELNVDRGDGGRDSSPPRWCTDGSVVMQRCYWRREIRSPWRPQPARYLRVCEQRRKWWNGSGTSLADRPDQTAGQATTP